MKDLPDVEDKLLQFGRNIWQGGKVDCAQISPVGGIWFMAFSTSSNGQLQGFEHCSRRPGVVSKNSTCGKQALATTSLAQRKLELCRYTAGTGTEGWNAVCREGGEAEQPARRKILYLAENPRLGELNDLSRSWQAQRYRFIMDVEL